MPRPRLLLPLLPVFLGASLLIADEGIWTFDNIPAKQLKERYNFVPSAEWLRHLQLSCARFNDGGSGSFISADGLVLTNHHVARGQLQKNSTAEHDYIKNGFYAPTQDQEIKSPDLEVNVLESTENVTDQVAQAVNKVQDVQEQFKARKAVIAGIERKSQEATGLRSDVVTLYSGGEYWLYRYKKYTDVRIVFAPEQHAAFYGGDPDNFTYPRYDLDLAIFRVYENGKPIHTDNYLKWNEKGASSGELVFVAGNPGGTDRSKTMSQILFARDVSDPLVLDFLANQIDIYQRYAAEGPEQAREASADLFSLQNAQKAIRGRHDALLDKATTAKKQGEEDKFRAAVMANPEWKTNYGNAWSEINAAMQKAPALYRLQMNRTINSDLMELAERIVTYVSEVKKPAGERLPGYQASQLDSLRYRMLSPAPIYPGLEKASIAGDLQFALKKLGSDDPFVRTILDGRTPEQAAADLVNGTKLAKPALRKQLLEGGTAAVDASTDSMIVMARKLDPIRREMIKNYEDNVRSVTQRAGEQLGKARFLVYGKSIYPDATFTLRLSYGQVKGYPMNGTIAPPKTTLFGLYDRAASFNYEPPFDLVSRFQEGRTKLDLSTPFNFVTTNDIIGGNSGSPVVNRNGELVGLIFDGNIESLAGDYVYDERVNRAVAVHTAGMTEALRKLYNVGPLLKDIGISETAAAPLQKAGQ
jgi:Peptidase S46